MNSIPLPQTSIKRGHIRVWTPSEGTHRKQKSREGGGLREQLETTTHHNITGRVIPTPAGAQHWARYTGCAGFAWDTNTVDIDTAMLLLMLHAPQHYDKLQGAHTTTERVQLDSARWNNSHRLQHEPRGTRSHKVIFAGMTTTKRVVLDELRTSVSLTARNTQAFIHAPIDAVPVYNVQVFDLTGKQAAVCETALAA